MIKDVCAQCETPTLMEVVDSRLELGRELKFKYHQCKSCGLVQALDEDLKWNVEQMQAFYGERANEVRRSMTLEQKRAYLKAHAWCFWRWLVALVEIPAWPWRPTITTDISGKVVGITASDEDSRIGKTFWKEKK